MKTAANYKNRCVFFCDEFGTLPKIESAEMMFSASRSRRLQIVPIIQSFCTARQELRQRGRGNHCGQYAAHNIWRFRSQQLLGRGTLQSPGQPNCDVRLGQPVSKNDPSQSLQMIGRPLLTPDELKSLPKGQFVVMKTGVHPMESG